jgi:hypothetical protein
LVKPERKRKGGGDSVARQHDVAEAAALTERALRSLGMPTDTEGLSALRKGDQGKVQIAALLRKRTSVSNQWISDRLLMGNTSALSRLLGDFKKDSGNNKRMEKLERMSK